MSERNAAIVTGASRGIGKAVAIKLAENGCDVAIIYKGNEAAAEETASICREKGVDAICIKADVSVSADCKMVVKSVKEAFSKVDILVNNAGITRDNLLIKMSDEEFDQVINANLKGTFYMMRECIPMMLRSKVKKIVNISSVSGVLGNPGQANYSASKAGVIGLTKSAAREYASKKICVNAVAPGMIETDMTGSMDEKAREGVVSSIPFKEMGKAEDIANAVAFLAGNGADYITGQVLCVDGGMAI
ncbi:MAG: 3-oxoacyl-[acyl-carrier-protein] reductase [Lachnospiraceae bacterium]|nr:3-oxoacyl-[acyl-carrier-protein] reductase [Lachnospiraceae bacterium]